MTCSNPPTHSAAGPGDIDRLRALLDGIERYRNRQPIPRCAPADAWCHWVTDGYVLAFCDPVTASIAPNRLASTSLQRPSW
jgi:hypothetical protein